MPPPAVPGLSETYSRMVLRVADDQFARLAFVLEILRRRADGGERINDVAFAQRGSALESTTWECILLLVPILTPAPIDTIRADLNLVVRARPEDR